MPCCQWVLSLAKSSSNTPSWLHRLHAKQGGLSFPAHLQIDDLLYGQPQPPPPPPPTTPPPPPPPALLPPPPPPPPASSDRRLALIAPQDPLPNPKPPRDPARPNPSPNNTNHPPPQPHTQPPPPPPLSGVISDLFAVPSAPRSGRPPKPFRKQSRPRPKDKSATKDDKANAKARKRRRADRGAAGVVDGERRSKTDVTVIDTSTQGWKAAKLLIRRGTAWRVRDRKYSEISETEEVNKGKRRAGLVAKVLRDREREKEAALPGNIHAGSGYLSMVPGDDAIQTVKRPRSSEPVLGSQSAPILMLPSSSTISQP
ncbi:wiskott-Aldrich syndrome protein family member 2-like [Lolium rigidum]|uniref:wiskott-Aldrich syndrome protein family member 2-like n=1 Tax=Lolium rigidum TaxID=89674 RepID=UPI001F5C625A|nr:wiskott-Aldrich syndrome protein family member 2-like [Lolium rigidum]